MKIKTRGVHWMEQINDFNLNAKEAFKLMLDGKEIIDEEGYIYSLFFSNISYLKYENNIIKHRGETDANTFLKSNQNKSSKFKEYLEPKKPRKYEFEAFIGESINKMADPNCPFEEVIGHKITKFFKNDDIYTRFFIDKITKLKVTIEEICEVENV